jgi:uncharacterized damage-inducible protein DinB
MPEFEITPPESGEYGSFYANYIQKAGTGNILLTLEDHLQRLPAFFKSLPAEKWEYRYAPGKWSIKDILQHLIDGERVFSYRALRIARGDATPLPGFDENQFALAAGADQRSPTSLLEEYRAVRQATLLLLFQLSPAQWHQKGLASGHPVSVRALAFIIAGHEIHHLDIIRERYL